MSKFKKYISRAALVLPLFILLGLTFSVAQQPSFETSSCPEVKWTYKLSKSSGFQVGDVVKITFTGEVVDTKWHLYSSIPSPEMAYTATEFYAFPEETKGIEAVGGMTESVKPVVEPDEIMGGDVRYFKEHKVSFTQKFKITAEDVVLSGEVSGQYCKSPEDGGQCKPLRLPFEWKFKAKKKEEASTPPVDNSNSSNTEESTDNEENEGTVEAIISEEEEGDSTIAEVEIFTNDVTVSVEATVDTPPDDGYEEEDDGSNSGAWGMFIVAFISGILAIFTPCVFPMIPLTITFFTKQSKTRAEGIKKGLMYGGWIVFLYTFVGISVSLLIGPTGFYKATSHPITNIIFFVIFIVFALSFLGMFELTIPSGFVNKLDSKADRGGLIGSFFMALVLVLVSFSCTGPIVGGLMMQFASATSENIWTPAIGMLGFGLAFGVPFALLAMFPGLLNSLPKSGGWMNVLKVILGFLELAFAFKFFSNADLVWQSHILDRQVFLAIWIAIFFVLGLYLLNTFRMPHDSPIDKIKVPRALMGVAAFAFVLYMIPGLWGANLPILEGLVPPMNNDIGVRMIGGGGHGGGDSGNSGHGAAPGSINVDICSLNDRKYIEIFKEKEAHGFCMFYDLDEAVEYAIEKDKPLFVDFTGHTCANCRKMESEVWIKPKVMSLLTEDYVMVSLYVDDKTPLPEKYVTPEGNTIRRLGDKWLDLEGTDYQKFAQPYYVLMDPHEYKNGPKSSNLANPRGYTPDAETYQKFLERGVSVYKSRHGE